MSTYSLLRSRVRQRSKPVPDVNPRLWKFAHLVDLQQNFPMFWVPITADLAKARTDDAALRLPARQALKAGFAAALWALSP